MRRPGLEDEGRGESRAAAPVLHPTQVRQVAHELAREEADVVILLDPSGPEAAAIPREDDLAQPAAQPAGARQDRFDEPALERKAVHRSYHIEKLVDHPVPRAKIAIVSRNK